MSDANHDTPEKSQDGADRSGISVPQTTGLRLSVISGSDLSIMASFARGEGGEDVLLPLVEWFVVRQPAMTEKGPESGAFSATVTLDNAAFLVSDMCEDLMLGIERLSRVSRDAGMLCEVPFADMIDWLRQAARNAGKAADDLAAIEENCRS